MIPSVVNLTSCVDQERYTLSPTRAESDPGADHFSPLPPEEGKKSCVLVGDDLL